MNLKSTVIIVPVNDAEAVLILKIAKAIGLAAIISAQAHGATLDKEPKIISKIKKSGAKTVVIVEIPGIKTEERIKKLGLQVKIIDHHHYQNLNRKKLKSSLEQFLLMLKITDGQLVKLDFDARLVRGIGILDRGFINGLKKEKYTKKEIKNVFAYQKQLLRPFTDPTEEKKYERAARAAWQKRKEWNGYTIIIGRTKAGFRRHLSAYLYQKFSQPIPIILDERGRGVVSIQDSPAAERLFKKFGGFTFGEKGNWGYKNQPGRKKVTLADVKKELN